MMKTQMDGQMSGDAAARAEASGWDRAGGYFVEGTYARAEGNRLVICLGRAMAQRSVLFVRMMLADGTLERVSRLMQVARSDKDKHGAYCVHCRDAQPLGTAPN